MQTVFYANINKKCISRKVGSAPVDYMHNTIVKISSGLCKVSSARHRAIVSSGSREVCAKVHTAGSYEVVKSVPSNVVPVSYNPKKYADRDYFYRCDNGERVTNGVFYLVHDDTFNTLNNVKLFMEI